MSEPVSPLRGHEVPAGLVVGIEDAGPQGMVSLKADLSLPETAKAVKSAVGLAIPGPLQATFAKGRGAVWMAPDELLLRMNHADAPKAAAALAKSLAGAHHLALDLSDARAVIRLTGLDVAEVLAKGVPADLSPEAFPVGAARRTHLGQIAVAFWRISHEEWEIVALRSYAAHLIGWLEASAQAGGRVGAF